MPLATPPTDRDVLEALTHRLGSPLGATVNFLHLLRAGVGSDQTVSGLASATDSARAILDATRRWTEATAAPLDLQDLDPAPLIARAADEAGLRGRLEVGPLPDVLACPDAFLRQWREILTNAAQVASDGRIQVRVAEGEGTIEITVVDSGPGWTADEIERAFAPFSTLPDRPSGAGMGLAIVTALAARQGGGAGGRSASGGAEVLLIYRAT